MYFIVGGSRRVVAEVAQVVAVLLTVRRAALVVRGHEVARLLRLVAPRARLLARADRPAEPAHEAALLDADGLVAAVVHAEEGGVAEVDESCWLSADSTRRCC